MSAAEIERGLVAAGVPSDRARAEALRQTANRAAAFPQANPNRAETGLTASTAHTVHYRVIINPELPINLRIPWSALVSDNAKYGVLKGKLIAQKPYREAKRAIGALARDVMQGRPPAAIPLQLVAKVYVPDRRVHDVVNFSKCVHDSLKGTVFVDDQWLHDIRWIRAGVDVDAPRCELTISPLTPS
jgi:hypothetical protein